MDDVEAKLDELHKALDWLTNQRQVATPGPIQLFMHLAAKEQARLHGLRSKPSHPDFR